MYLLSQFLDAQDLLNTTDFRDHPVFFSLRLGPACCPDKFGMTTKYSMWPNMHFVYYRQDCIIPAHGRVTFATLTPKTTLVSRSGIITSIKCTSLLIKSFIGYEENMFASISEMRVFDVMWWLSYDFSCWARFSFCFFVWKDLSHSFL